MLYSYAGFPESSWSLFEHSEPEANEKGIVLEAFAAQAQPNIDHGVPSPDPIAGPSGEADFKERLPEDATSAHSHRSAVVEIISGTLIQDRESTENIKRRMTVKQNTMSGLSIVLTLISILVAFRYELSTY